MATEISNGITTLTPTRWKWVIGAILVFSLPLLGFFLTGLFLAVAFGALHRLILKPYGFEVRSWGKTREYRWDEVGSFDVHTYRYMFFPLIRRITFTPFAKEGKLLTRASKLFSGGTDTIPAIGLSAKKLSVLMNQYRDNYLAASGPERLEIGTFVPRTKSETARPKSHMPSLPPPIAAKEKQNFIKPKNPSGMPRTSDLEALGKGRKQDPLVQDSFARRWRTRN